MGREWQGVWFADLLDIITIWLDISRADLCRDFKREGLSPLLITDTGMVGICPGIFILDGSNAPTYTAFTTSMNLNSSSA